jgi:hypothetical protein
MPSQVEPQTHDAQRAPNEATADSGSEDEALRAFNQRAQSQAQNEPEAPTDEPQDDDPPEPDEGEPNDDVDAADTLVEVEYEGETHKLSPKLKDALLRQADYSRNMQALGESKKDYAQRIESATKLIEGAEKYADVIAEGKQIDAQIEQYKAVDWNTLERDDPARASLLAVKYLQLQQTRASLDSKAQALDKSLADERLKVEDAARVEMVKTLSKEFPGGWNDASGKRLGDYVLSQGLTSADLQRVTDAKTVLLWEKARKFDAIEAGKAKALAQTREAPALARPGAPRRAAPAADAQARFQKSTSPEDAVALFEARAGQRKR